MKDKTTPVLLAELQDLIRRQLEIAKELTLRGMGVFRWCSECGAATDDDGYCDPCAVKATEAHQSIPPVLERIIIGMDPALPGTDRTVPEPC